MNTYQLIYQGKPFGSPVSGHRVALKRRRMVVAANCNRKPPPVALSIVDTPGVSQCCSCECYCECRLRKVVRRG